jgi:hypothetical protein
MSLFSEVSNFKYRFSSSSTIFDLLWPHQVPGLQVSILKNEIARQQGLGNGYYDLEIISNEQPLKPTAVVRTNSQVVVRRVYSDNLFEIMNTTDVTTASAAVSSFTAPTDESGRLEDVLTVPVAGQGVSGPKAPRRPTSLAPAVPKRFLAGDAAASYVVQRQVQRAQFRSGGSAVGDGGTVGIPRALLQVDPTSGYVRSKVGLGREQQRRLHTLHDVTQAAEEARQRAEAAEAQGAKAAPAPSNLPQSTAPKTATTTAVLPLYEWVNFHPDRLSLAQARSRLVRSSLIPALDHGKNVGISLTPRTLEAMDLTRGHLRASSGRTALKLVGKLANHAE